MCSPCLLRPFLAVVYLRQAAALGPVKAVDRFGLGGGAFESCAVPTITGEVERHFRDRTRTLRVRR
jgi:RNA polymerase sigma-B factor